MRSQGPWKSKSDYSSMVTPKARRAPHMLPLDFTLDVELPIGARGSEYKKSIREEEGHKSSIIEDGWELLIYANIM